MNPSSNNSILKLLLSTIIMFWITLVFGDIYSQFSGVLPTQARCSRRGLTLPSRYDDGVFWHCHSPTFYVVYCDIDKIYIPNMPLNESCAIDSGSTSVKRLPRSSNDVSYPTDPDWPETHLGVLVVPNTACKLFYSKRGGNVWINECPLGTKAIDAPNNVAYTFPTCWDKRLFGECGNDLLDPYEYSEGHFVNPKNFQDCPDGAEIFQIIPADANSFYYCLPNFPNETPLTTYIFYCYPPYVFNPKSITTKYEMPCRLESLVTTEPPVITTEAPEVSVGVPKPQSICYCPPGSSQDDVEEHLLWCNNYYSCQPVIGTPYYQKIEYKCPEGQIFNVDSVMDKTVLPCIKGDCISTAPTPPPTPGETDGIFLQDPLCLCSVDAVVGDLESHPIYNNHFYNCEPDPGGPYLTKMEYTCPSGYVFNIASIGNTQHLPCIDETLVPAPGAQYIFPRQFSWQHRTPPHHLYSWRNKPGFRKKR